MNLRPGRTHSNPKDVFLQAATFVIRIRSRNAQNQFCQELFTINKKQQRLISELPYDDRK